MNQSFRVFRASVFLILTLATLAVYARTFGYGFVVYDDTQYVYQNPMVRHGITAEGLRWAFTTFWAANWHPLTWLSLMLDCQFFGANPGEAHAVNVFIHLASSLALFLVLWRTTLHRWRSALVAGIFALHPLHVESVAWIAERKDVLSTFFEMLTLALYVFYVSRPSRKRYAAVAGTFALALLSKPMAVTFPLVLLFVDFWPLGRMGWPPERREIGKLLGEKLPLLALSVPACVLTFLAQRGSHAVVAVERYPMWMRLGNAAIAYVRYLGKTFWPTDLAVLYPLERPTWPAVAGGVALLALITAAAVRIAGTRPYLLTGWLWYLGMLVPVIGLVQVGVQAIADRYMYVPMVGISLALVWLVADAVQGRALLRRLALGFAVAGLALCAAVAYRQVGYWSSSKSLFAHAFAITSHNYIVENNLGIALAHEGNYEGAIRMYRLALAASPDWPDALTNLGATLTVMGRATDAVKPLERALQINPKLAQAHASLGATLCALGRYDDCRVRLEQALSLHPYDVTSESNLCLSFQRLGRLDEAAAHCRAALRLEPNYPDAHFNLGSTLAAQGHKQEAAAEFRRVLAAQPKNAAARAELEKLQ